MNIKSNGSHVDITNNYNSINFEDMEANINFKKLVNVTCYFYLLFSFSIWILIAQEIIHIYCPTNYSAINPFVVRDPIITISQVA